MNNNFSTLILFNNLLTENILNKSAVISTSPLTQHYNTTDRIKTLALTPSYS